MDRFWQKPIFWIVFCIILIPLCFYFFKGPILSFLPPSLINKSSSPIAAKPGQCLILEEKYCSSGTKIDWQYQGKTYTYIAFKLPAGIPLFAAEDGELAKAKEDNQPFSGFLAELINEEGTSALLLEGDMHFDDMINKTLKTGDIIGIIQDTGAKSFGDYNFFITINKSTANGPVTDEDTLGNLFKTIKK